MFAVYNMSKWHAKCKHSTDTLTILALVLNSCVLEWCQCYGMYYYLRFTTHMFLMKWLHFNEQEVVWMYTAASLKIAWLYAWDSCLYICLSIVFIINHISSTNWSSFIMFSFIRNTVSHFKMSQSGNLSRYYRFYYK